MKVEIAITPCPNDTFVYYHLSKGFISGHPVRLNFFDIEELNQMILEKPTLPYHAIKISAAVYPKIKDRYDILPCGGAYTDSAGPILISYQNYQKNKKPIIDKVLTPGQHTTAHLLTKHFLEELQPNHDPLFIPRKYDEIFQGMLEGAANFGIIIHEDRFYYEEHGLFSFQDLGEWWQSKVAGPLPLGLLVCPNNLKTSLRQDLVNKVRSSILKAQAQPKAFIPFIKKHASNLHDNVINKHIQLFVNEYTINPDKNCTASILKLNQMDYS